MRFFPMLSMPSSLTPSMARRLRVIALVVWAGSTTLIMQQWIGSTTIYKPEFVPRIMASHQAIIDNRIPSDTTWSLLGLNTTNIRVGSVFLVEGIHRATGIGIPKVYRTLDTVMLFASLVLLVVFLGRLVPREYAVLGALGFAMVLPLTYQLFYFHPWDRLSLFFWILLLMVLEQRRVVVFAVLLVIAMVIKFDVLLLPGLYFLATVPPLRDRQGVFRTALVTAGLFAVTFGVYEALQVMRPGGFEPVPLGTLQAENLQILRDLGIAYPPLLGFPTVLMLAAVGFGKSARFPRACMLFALLLLPIYVVRSRFEEFRTELPVFLLLLPAALVGVRTLCDRTDRTLEIQHGP